MKSLWIRLGDIIFHFLKEFSLSEINDQLKLVFLCQQSNKGSLYIFSHNFWHHLISTLVASTKLRSRHHLKFNSNFQLTHIFCNISINFCILVMILLLNNRSVSWYIIMLGNYFCNASIYTCLMIVCILFFFI